MMPTDLKFSRLRSRGNALVFSHPQLLLFKFEATLKLVILFPKASLRHWAGRKQSAASSDASMSTVSSAKGLQALRLENTNAWPEASHGEQDLLFLKRRLLHQMAELVNKWDFERTPIENWKKCLYSTVNREHYYTRLKNVPIHFALWTFILQSESFSVCLKSKPIFGRTRTAST